MVEVKNGEVVTREEAGKTAWDQVVKDLETLWILKIFLSVIENQTILIRFVRYF